MTSTFMGVDIFGSGPHRFHTGRAALRVLSLAFTSGDSTLPGSLVLGDIEPGVVVRGRLVASSEAALLVLREAIEALIDSSSLSTGALVDVSGRTYGDMTLESYEELGPVDRGRVWSVGYVAAFRDILTV